MGDQGSTPGGGREGSFFLRHRVQTGSETHIGLLSNGYGVLFSRR